VDNKHETFSLSAPCARIKQTIPVNRTKDKSLGHRPDASDFTKQSEVGDCGMGDLCSGGRYLF
jgi:hypothetical protein